MQSTRDTRGSKKKKGGRVTEQCEKRKGKGLTRRGRNIGGRKKRVGGVCRTFRARQNWLRQRGIR